MPVVMRALCYDEDLHTKLQLNSSVLVKNFTKGYTSLVFKYGTTIIRARDINVPDGVAAIGHQILNPAPPRQVHLQDLVEPEENAPPTYLDVEGII